MAFGDLLGTLNGSAASITNPFSATGSVSVSVGDLVVALVAEQASLTVTACSDNLGNTYSAQNAGTSNTETAKLYYSRVTVAGTLTSISITCTASSDDVNLPCAVFAGPFATSPLDANPANTTTDTTSPYTCPATGTLSQANELIVAWGVRQASISAWSATSPNLLAIDDNSLVPKATIGYQVVSSTSSVAPEFTAGIDPTKIILGTCSFMKAASSFSSRYYYDMSTRQFNV